MIVHVGDTDVTVERLDNGSYMASCRGYIIGIDTDKDRLLKNLPDAVKINKRLPDCTTQP